MRTLVLLVLFGGGLVVAGERVGPDGVRPRPDGVRPQQPTPAQPNPELTRTADDVEADAKALLDEFQACAGACEVASFTEVLGSESCVGAFQCATALPPDFDRGAFIPAARALDAEMRALGVCHQAACRPPEELVAACVEGRCELVPSRAEPTRPMPPVR